MRRPGRYTIVGVVGCLLAVTVGANALANAAPDIVRPAAVRSAATVDNHVTLASTGAPETTTNGSVTRAVSANGRFVVFSSQQPNLVPGVTTDGGVYLYLYDTAYGTTTQVSHGQIGAITGNAAISADGRYTVYSAETNPNASNALYRYDRVAGTTTVITRAKPSEANSGVGFAADITADGRYVVYVRSSGPDGDHVTRHLYRYDATTGVSSLVIPGDLRGTIDRVYSSAIPSISADGRYVTYLQSTPTKEQLGSKFSLILLDTTTNAKTTIITSGYAYYGVISDPSISDNGRYVAYAAYDADTQGGQVYRFDAHSGVSTLVSRTPSGAKADGNSGEPQISGDGGYVVYDSSATTIVPGAGSNSVIYVYDAGHGTTEAILRDTHGNLLSGPNNMTYLPYIDGTGHTVAFTSSSRKLVSSTTSLLERVYAWQRP